MGIFNPSTCDSRRQPQRYSRRVQGMANASVAVLLGVGAVGLRIQGRRVGGTIETCGA